MTRILTFSLGVLCGAGIVGVLIFSNVTLDTTPVVASGQSALEAAVARGDVGIGPREVGLTPNGTPVTVVPQEEVPDHWRTGGTSVPSKMTPTDVKALHFFRDGCVDPDWKTRPHPYELEQVYDWLRFVAPEVLVETDHACARKIAEAANVPFN